MLKTILANNQMLKKDPAETISLWESLSKEEFLVTLEVLDEIIQKTQSHEILDAVKRIGKEKGIDDKMIARLINQALCWLDH